MHIALSRRALALGAMLIALVPSVASADLREPRPPLAENLIGPLGFDVKSSTTIVVGQSFAGLLTEHRDGMQREIISVPDGEVAGVEVANGGVYYATSTYAPDGTPTGAGVGFFKQGKTQQIADLLAYENANNPDGATEYGFVGMDDECAAQVPPEVGGAYNGIVESHPYAVAVQRKTVFVADAAANAIFEVAPNGQISTLAVLPPQPLSIDAGLAAAFGLPDCAIGHDYLFESVPTDVEIGNNRWLYVSTLPGGPEDPGFPGRGGVWRIHTLTGEIQQLAAGLAGATDIALGPQDSVWVTEMFGNRVSKIVQGQAVPWAELPAPAAIEYFRGQLYVAYDVFAGGTIATISR